jgi:hypothetical protein
MSFGVQLTKHHSTITKREPRFRVRHRRGSPRASSAAQDPVDLINIDTEL